MQAAMVVSVSTDYLSTFASPNPPCLSPRSQDICITVFVVELLQAHSNRSRHCAYRVERLRALSPSGNLRHLLT
jgi:hypothetical protein